MDSKEMQFSRFFSSEEIAADINIQPDSVRAALSRARKKARKLILEEKAL